MKKSQAIKILSVGLAVIMAISVFGVSISSGRGLALRTRAESAATGSADRSVTDYIVYTSGASESESVVSPFADRQRREAAQATQELLKNGAIRIFNYRQLELIGSGAPLTSADADEDLVGTGRYIADENGDLIVYSKDADYILEKDIPLPNYKTWRLPEDFTGSFISRDEGVITPYDRATDTIRIYNLYQLATVASPRRAEIPVMSRDGNAATYGTGQLFNLNGESGGCVTYSSGHNIVISKSFTASLPDAPPLSLTYVEPDSTHTDGRDYFGQVTVAIDGEDYILIGCRQQLDAINYGKDEIKVYRPIYKVTQTRGNILDNWNTATKTEEMIYPGDADLITGGFESKPLYDEGKSGLLSSGEYPNIGTLWYRWDVSLTGLTRTRYCTLDSNGECTAEGSHNIEPDTGLVYSRSGKYIIFRDIDLNDAKWTPLMFTGTMLGVKSTGGGKLWDDGKTKLFIDVGNKPVISGFDVEPQAVSKNGDMHFDSVTQTGVGFFGTISGRLDSASVRSEQATVRNIRVSNFKIENRLYDVEVNQTLVSGLLNVVTTLLGPILNSVLGTALGRENFDIGTTLQALLNARKNDPSTLAVGGFAGRIVGNVEISDCEVENADITAVKTVFENDGKIVGTGGFVGYAAGEWKYDALSNALGTVGEGLSRLLNLIPGVGLGDLTQVLLGNALPAGNLIPTGYASATISGCAVIDCEMTNADGKLGVGGFVGAMSGTIITDSYVVSAFSQNSPTLEINAARFGGGFAGVERDDILKATLSDLGINAASLYPQSEIAGCSMICKYSVTGGSCLGGFIGVQAASYAIDNTIDDACGEVIVSGSGDNIGGFTGLAQLGSLYGLTDYLKDDASLLSTVKGLLTSALSNSPSQQLLALGGVSPSAILGGRIYAPVAVTANGGSRVGGLVGSGEAVRIGRTDEKGELVKYSGYQPSQGEERHVNVVVRLVSISATKTRAGDNAVNGNYVGGAVGFLKSAYTGSLLGSTLGLTSHLEFSASDIIINGADEGLTVSADGDYAGGALGFAIGGDIDNVRVYRIKSVEAHNHAGGFVGTTGVDRVSGGDGLNVQLLGLSLIKINNLLSLTGGIHTNITSCSVNGVSEGFTVKAGMTSSAETDAITAGGFAGDATSVTVKDCHAVNLLSVRANDDVGLAGGFVGRSAEGSLSGVDTDDNGNGSAIDLDQLLKVESDLVPSFYNCDVSYLDGGCVHACTAGGFVGEHRSGKINDEPDTSDMTAEEKAEAEALDKELEDSPYVVYNIDHVRGGKYAGGYGGNVESLALMKDGGSGLSLLGGNVRVDTTQLANSFSHITQAYIPTMRYAGINNPSGFSVYAAYVSATGNDSPADKGFAGGYIGFASGVHVSCSNVNKLRTGKIDPPKPLEDKDGSEYMAFDPAHDKIPYAVAGARYAGGYVGYINVGSANILGDGITALGESVDLTGVLDSLDVVRSVIEHSDVYGCPGGYSVVASSHVNLGDGEYDENGAGTAGGFAGLIAGAHIQDSNAENFAYIIGEIAAGGYAGVMKPGNVADVLNYDPDDNSEGGLKSILSSVVSADLSLVEAFVPTIRNSRTTCIPCGGAVRAQSLSDSAMQRGFAGGYVGRASAAQIWGDNSAAWAEETVYSGPKRDCDAIRIRSVYGAEYAGGFVGLLEPGSTAKTGNLSLLGGLVSATNLLGALNLIYPIVENANVYGPLEQLDVDTWDKWSQYIGMYGGFAGEISDIIERTSAVGNRLTQQELDSILEDFTYGYTVVAGRDEYDGSSVNTGLCGCAGGYAGAMHGGSVRRSLANNVKQVRAMRAAGGFVGEMQSKGLVDFGSASILGLNLDLGGLLNVTNILTPVVFESGVNGYQKGLIVRAEGTPTVERIISAPDAPDVVTKTVYTDGGMAGGFVGACYGGQLGVHDGRLNFSVEEAEKGVWVDNLKTVTGKSCIGGFAGKTSAASVANIGSSEAENDFVQGLINNLIAYNPAQLVDVLDATITVIKMAKVSPADESWGIVIDGEYTDGGKTKYASCAGGFVGSSEATVIGDRRQNEPTGQNSNPVDLSINVSGLRGVSGGCYVGGFFGLAEVGSVAQVGGEQENTTLLNLIQAGNVSLLDVFRTYIYYANVTGVEDGIRIFANDQQSSGSMSDYEISGAAGGFGGGLMNGTVLNSTVSDLKYVRAPHYAAGFIGKIGTSNGIGVDAAAAQNDTTSGLLSVLGLGDLALNPQLLNVVGSTVNNCTVTGVSDGFVINATERQIIETPQEDEDGQTGDVVHEADLKGSCVAGFAGYADMAHIENCHVEDLNHVKGEQIAGGFVGKTAMNYLVDVDIDSKLTGAVVKVVNVLVEALYLKDAQEQDVINLGTDFAGLKLMSDGDLLYINLFGLKIGASLCKNDPEYDGHDSVIVTVGSSTIKLPCDDENGVGESPDISITLIEGNRTDIKSCTVKGIPEGYDVFAGGADDSSDGTDSLGYAGGFIGYNYAGMVSDSSSELCDVVRGTPNETGNPSLVGAFIGYTNPGSRGVELLEHNNNHYSIYRPADGMYNKLTTSGGTEFADVSGNEYKIRLEEEDYNRYVVEHLVLEDYSDLMDTVESDGTDTRALKAYVSPAKATLMADTVSVESPADYSPMPGELKDPCDGIIDLTINKMWEEFSDFDTRPASITVTVTQVEAGSNPPDRLINTDSWGNKTVVDTYVKVLDASDELEWNASWQRIVKDLPVADKNSDDGTTVYYQYYISEEAVDGYKASYELEQSTSTANITNRYVGELLPQTGGPGAVLFYTTGLLLTALGAALLYHRYGRGKLRRRVLRSSAGSENEDIDGESV